MADLSPQLWLNATIEAIRNETPRIKTFRLRHSGAYPFVAGQHCSVQVTSPDGLSVARDYSFSSAPSTNQIDLTVARMPDGELSGWLNEQADVGAMLEISPALGSTFCWVPTRATPTLLIGGGVGIAPLMSMWREHQLQKSKAPMQLLYSCRSIEDICFKDELLAADNVRVNISNLNLMPSGWTGGQGRLDRDQLQPYLLTGQAIYICGSSTFVTDIANILIALGTDNDDIHREMFS